MSTQRQFKIESATLILSVAILALVFGVLLDERVVPDANKTPLTEQAVEKYKTAKSVATKAKINRY